MQAPPMRFTLTYRGQLGGSGSKAPHKHAIRRQLHQQLQDLWRHKPLSEFADAWLGISKDPTAQNVGVALREVGGHSFVVLVQEQPQLVAELDILLLRPQAPGAIVQHTDIDNRLKVLFDALRRPQVSDEIPKGWMPDVGEKPLFCLLDDDRLVTRVNVETDRLLAPSSGDDVELTLRIQLRASRPSWNTVSLIY
jgi:hypothetical protein